MVSFARRVSADHAALSSARHSAVAWMHEQAGPECEAAAADMAVVLTELVANVIDHTDAADVDVALRVEDGRFVLEVANDGAATDLPSVDLWGRLQEDDRGRGLRLVAAFCDEVVVDGDDHRTRISCSRLYR